MKVIPTGARSFITFNSIIHIIIGEDDVKIIFINTPLSESDNQEWLKRIIKNNEKRKKVTTNLLLHFEMIQRGDFNNLHDDEDIIPKKLKEFLGIVKRPVVGTDD